MKINKNSDMAETLIGSVKKGKLEQIMTMIPFIGSNKPVISVLRLGGTIGRSSKFKEGLNFESMNKLIERAFEGDKVEAVCLVINSPGGAPVQAELIAKRIESLSKEKEVPVYSFVEDVAASGGYWLACAADKIFASKSSIIGSIGVISSGFGFQEAISKLGIERRVYSQGKNKSVLDPFLPAKDSDVELIKKIQKNIHAHFIDYVKSRRSNRLTQTDEILFNGEFWAGDIALDYGLIDGIDDMYSFINKHYGPAIKINYIESKQSWIKRTFNVQIPEKIGVSIADTAISNIEQKLLHNRFNLD